MPVRSGRRSISAPEPAAETRSGQSCGTSCRGDRRRQLDWSTLEKHEPVQQCEEQPEAKGESEIETTGHQIDLEAAIGHAVDKTCHVEQILHADLAEYRSCQH